jgi:hypothetical protein
MAEQSSNFKPFVSPETNMAEFTVKSVLTGAAFGIIFGASTVYLALKAGLTVSASIPIAVLAITLGRRFLKTTILENNIIQTTGSAGESIAAGVVFTLPGFLFLSEASSASYFNYFTILILAIVGGHSWYINDDPFAAFAYRKRAWHSSISGRHGLCISAEGGRAWWRVCENRIYGFRICICVCHPAKNISCHC